MGQFNLVPFIITQGVKWPRPFLSRPAHFSAPPLIIRVKMAEAI